MDRDELYYLTPYLLSLLLSVGIFSYAWRHRHIRGARPFTWLMAGQTLTILGFLFELVSTNLEAKIFWDTLQWLTAGSLVILPFLIFAVQFSEHELGSSTFFWGMILTFLALFAAFLLTDNFHHLFYSNPRLTAGEPFPELTYDFTWPIYIYLLLYVYGASIFGIALLIMRAFEPRLSFRQPYLIVAFGFLLPLIFSMLTLSSIQLAPQRDLTPIASATGSLIAAWGLFRYGLFDILPMAREHLFESTADPVIVFDPRNRITDINQATLILLRKQKTEVIGRTPRVALASWPSLIEVVNNPFVQRKEVSVIRNGRALFFDVNISHIFGNKRELIGRLLSAHEITTLKTLEADYQILSNELEQRVQKRIKELQHTAERYRTIIENHTDFIVRWKPDGTRTFVNEAYCRYWDITSEQALARNFLFHTIEENRPDIEEKISRFNSGKAESETEIYQITRPDGTLAWQEWTDTAIRDEWGKLIEIQSVGRDITARRRAEERLNS
jgi:PAS domain S-box-containing protein